MYPFQPFLLLNLHPTSPSISSIRPRLLHDSLLFFLFPLLHALEERDWVLSDGPQAELRPALSSSPSFQRPWLSREIPSSLPAQMNSIDREQMELDDFSDRWFEGDEMINGAIICRKFRVFDEI